MEVPEHSGTWKSSVYVGDVLKTSAKLQGKKAARNQAAKQLLDSPEYKALRSGSR